MGSLLSRSARGLRHCLRCVTCCACRRRPSETDRDCPQPIPLREAAAAECNRQEERSSSAEDRAVDDCAEHEDQLQGAEARVESGEKEQACAVASVDCPEKEQACAVPSVDCPEKEQACAVASVDCPEKEQACAVASVDCPEKEQACAVASVDCREKEHAGAEDNVKEQACVEDVDCDGTHACAEDKTDCAENSVDCPEKEQACAVASVDCREKEHAGAEDNVKEQACVEDVDCDSTHACAEDKTDCAEDAECTGDNVDCAEKEPECTMTGRVIDSTSLVESRLTALEKILDSAEQLPMVVAEVSKNARKLLQSIRQEQTLGSDPCSALTVDEYTASLNGSLARLEKLLDDAEARPATVAAVAAAVNELVASIRAG